MKRTVTLLLILVLAIGLCVPAAGASDAENQARERLTQAIRDWKAEVNLSDLNIQVDAVRKLLQRMYDAPEFFYYDYPIIWSDGSSGKVSRVELYYKSSFDRSHVQVFETEVERVLGTLLPGMDDLQKAIVLHDYLAVNTAYDYDNLRAGTVPDVSHTAYGALVLGVAVCEGYAKAYQLLLERCGIPAAYVSSDDMNHGWNLVQLGGQWYHVDVTWDDPTPDAIGRAEHEYFLLSDAAMGDSEHEHYNWEADYACTDTRYDRGAFWSEQEQPLVFTDRDTLWLLKEQGNGREQSVTLVSRSWSTGEETARYTFWDYWPVWDGGGYYWTDAYSALCLWDRRVFFTDSRHIYSYDPADGTAVTEYEYDAHDGYFYGLTVWMDELYVVVKQDPYESGTTYKFTPERKYAAAPEPQAPVNPFTDVSESAYYYDAVMWAYDNNVTKGTGDTTFSPWNACTRGQVVTFLWRAVGCPAPQTAVNPFADVPEGEYYRDAVLWAVEQGITNGTGTDPATGKQLFSPNAECTYAHILTFLWRTVTGEGSSSYGEWYSEPLDWAGNWALLLGTSLGDGTGGVMDNCPRCDVVTFLCRAVGN